MADGSCPASFTSIDARFKQECPAEGTSNHEIDILWAMNVTTGKLTRIQSTPYGAEVTGAAGMPTWEASAISSVMMEPFGDKDDILESERPTVTEDMQRSHVGVIGLFPKLVR